MRFAAPFLSIIASVAFSPSHAAVTIEWGNDPATFNLQDSSGSFLNASFKFELGTFADGDQMPGTPVDPASQSYATLHNFWKPIDFAIDPAASGWNPALRQFAGSVTLTETGANTNVANTDGVASTDLFADPQHAIGAEKLYIWVHNGTLHSGGDATEVALFTAATWTILDYDILHGLPQQINLSDATTDIYGSTNNAPTYDLKTQAMPEPSTGLLLSLAGCILAMRRRRPCPQR